MKPIVYEPPKQSFSGQIIDVVVILALVFGALWMPAILGLTGAGTVTTQLADPTWEKLGQNSTMQKAWERLDIDVKDAAPIILTRFDYKIDVVPFLITMLLVVGYFVFVIRYSQRQYRDVVRERFGERETRR